jgi:hypothetical protein
LCADVEAVLDFGDDAVCAPSTQKPAQVITAPRTETYHPVRFILFDSARVTFVQLPPLLYAESAPCVPQKPRTNRGVFPHWILPGSKR